MKVLMLAPYFYDGIHRAFSRNQTGFGRIVPQIAAAIGKYHDVAVLTYMPTSEFIKEQDGGKFTVLSHTAGSLIGWGCLQGISQTVHQLIKGGQEPEGRIHSAYRSFNIPSIRRAIIKYQPDIIHIHGMEFPLIALCQELKIPFLVTLHGLNGFRSDISSLYYQREMAFMNRAAAEKIPISVISSGMRRRIYAEYLKNAEKTDIFVTPNGTPMVNNALPLPESRKAITVIGTLSENKNQKEVIEAAAQIKDQISDYEIHICGGGDLQDQLQRIVDGYGLQGIIQLHGYMKAEEISSLLDKACLNVLASKEEGFGLSIIEGFMHGVPSVFFSDIDAAEDLYSEDAVLLCKTRNTEDFAETILSALQRNWDSAAIQKHGQRFSLDTMAQRYLEVYRTILSR